jgi:hypothetical protein
MLAPPRGRWQQDSDRIEDHMSRLAGHLVGTVLALALASLPVRAQANLLSSAGVGYQPARAADKARPQSAPCEQYVVLDICDNFKNAQQRKACIGDANGDLRATKSDYQDRQQTRQPVCWALGQSPYNLQNKAAAFVVHTAGDLSDVRSGHRYGWAGRAHPIAYVLISWLLALLLSWLNPHRS